MSYLRLTPILGKLLDSLAISLCLVIPVIYLVGVWTDPYTVALLISIIAFSSFSGMIGLYQPWHGFPLIRILSRAWMSWIATLSALLLVAYLSDAGKEFSRPVIIIWFFVAPLTMMAWRLIAQALFVRIISNERFRKKVIVWGSGYMADSLIGLIRESPHLGLTLVDHIITNERDTDRRREDGYQRGIQYDSHRRTDSIYEDLVRRAKQGEFNVLYIARQGFSSARLNDTIDCLADTAVSVYLVPDFSTIDLFQGHWSSLGGIPTISVFETPFLGVDGSLKRLEDIVFALFILSLAAVPMLLIAILVKLSSPGPVLFAQRRYGLAGQPIKVLKFRTMTVMEDGADVVQARPGDERVTRTGRFLRCTSLDELPQFINVLRGEMSVVGPRPHAMVHDEFYRDRVKGYILRRKVRPGITGWAQVNGWRGMTDDLYKMQKRIEYDFWYIRNWSLWLDLKIILLTIPRMVTGKNAY